MTMMKKWRYERMRDLMLAPRDGGASKSVTVANAGVCSGEEVVEDT